MKLWRQIPLELVFWITALVLLGWGTTMGSDAEPHFTFCPLANLGFNWCPGCGIGRSISHLLHGHVEESITQHWFGIPALIIILYRTGSLMKMTYRSGRQKNLKRKEKKYV